jgi:hypothetical protein
LESQMPDRGPGSVLPRLHGVDGNCAEKSACLQSDIAYRACKPVGAWQPGELSSSSILMVGVYPHRKQCNTLHLTGYESTCYCSLWRSFTHSC